MGLAVAFELGFDIGIKKCNTCITYMCCYNNALHSQYRLSSLASFLGSSNCKNTYLFMWIYVLEPE
jgi:hypothetical protein